MNLKVAAIEVFGEEKTEITYEDYTTLPEQKASRYR